jgi:hypothetical protein
MRLNCCVFFLQGDGIVISRGIVSFTSQKSSNFKKLISFLLVLSMAFTSLCAFASDEVKVYLNGEELSLSSNVIASGEEAFIPVEEFCSLLGFDFAFDGESATMTNASVTSSISLDKAEYKKNGMTTSLESAPFIEGGVLYAPSSALAALGAEAEWNSEENTLSVSVDNLANKYFRIIQKSASLALSLENGALGDGVRVMAEPISSSDTQVWKLSPVSEGVYQPLNKKSGRSFDIPNANTDTGMNLIQYGITMGENQFICPILNEDGSYYLKFKHCDLYLTVNDDLHITQEEFTGDDNQVFVLEEAVESASDSVENEVDEAGVQSLPLNGKIFKIRSVSSSSLLSTDANAMKGSKIALSASESDSSVWFFTAQGTGYMITNKESGFSLHEGNDLMLYPSTYRSEQIFTFTENGDGNYFISTQSDLFLTAKGNYVTLSEFTGEENQLFALESLTYSEDKYSHDPLGGKTYTIQNAFSKKNISVEDESLENSAKILTEEPSDSLSQVWTFVTLGKSNYILTNALSARSMDIPSASTLPGVSVTQYATNYGNNQIFEFIENSDGSYFIKNKNSKLYLTVKNGYITQEKFRNNNLQKFLLTEVGESQDKIIGAAATLFLLKGEDTVSNVKLQWNKVTGAVSYDIYRTEEGVDEEVLIASFSGTTLDDYDLEVGKSYSYRVCALDEDGIIDSVVTESVVPYLLPSDLKSSSNLVESSLSRPNSLYVDGVYYNFSSWGRDDGGTGFGRLMMRTSTDDITYGEWTEVLNYKEILENETCQGFTSCRFESQNFIYNKETNKFVFVAHFEADGGYGTAMTSIASATPGERFTFHRAIRPEGGDTRDLNVYVDDDNSAYLIAAINVNANLALYKFTEDWTDIEKLVCIVNRNCWRELPSMLKVDGRYYLFTSGTAGWYPTQGMYNTATSIEGPWSPLRSVGNSTTFSSQSGSVFTLKEGGENYVMSTYRWMYFWKDAVAKRTTNRRYPVKVSNGYAFYDFFEELLYNWENDVLVPVQDGRLLSQNMPSKSSCTTEDSSYANDGDYSTYWYGGGTEEWPFTWEVDLGKVSNLTELQISWLIWNGSEPYYSYKLEGSVDGVNYKTILDNTEGYTDYGFTVDTLSGTARYVRLTVTDAHSRSSDTNRYPAQLYEVKIFGN